MLVEGDQPAVGDGDAVGVARQIGQHRLGSAERALGVDDPFGLAQRRQIRREGLRVGEMGVIAEEAAGGRPAWAATSFSRNSRRNRRESTRTGRKKPGRQATQRLPSERDAAARHDHVDVRMMGQRRAPGVQHGGDADAGAEMLGIGGDRESGSRPRP